MPSSLWGSDSEEEEGDKENNDKDLNKESQEEENIDTSTILPSCLDPGQKIEGLYVIRKAVPKSVQMQLIERIGNANIFHNDANQSMLFTSQPAHTVYSNGKDRHCPTLDPINPLLDILPGLLEAHLPSSIYKLLFKSSEAVQAILNRYSPGQGISPHVDLPHRYADGIIGLSLISSAAFEFCKVGCTDPELSLLLQPGDLVVLTGKARYDYSHSIPYRKIDVFHDPSTGNTRTLWRLPRLSITLRRMLPNADIVGPE